MDKEFIEVCKYDDLIEKKGFRYFISDNTDIAVFKINGKIYAFDNVCPHNHTPKIHLGYVTNDEVICPVHFFKFSIHNGKHTENSGCNLKTYEVNVLNGIVYVEKPDDKSFNFDF